MTTVTKKIARKIDLCLVMLVVVVLIFKKMHTTTKQNWWSRGQIWANLILPLSRSNISTFGLGIVSNLRLGSNQKSLTFEKYSKLASLAHVIAHY